MQRLFTRTLVGYSKVNGTGFRLAPDLATSRGRHNSTFTRWSYTLKRGLKYSTGKPITPRDIKWGIERLFATNVVNGGPSSYFFDTIAHPRGYAGPYATATCFDPDDQPHDHFPPCACLRRLRSPHGIAGSRTGALSVEGGSRHRAGRYWTRPVASGPFEIKSYRPNRRSSSSAIRTGRSAPTASGTRSSTTWSDVDANPDDIDRSWSQDGPTHVLTTACARRSRPGS